MARTFPSAGLAPIDSYLVNPGARRAGQFSVVVDVNTATSPSVLGVSMSIGANAVSPTAFKIYVEPNLGSADPTMTTLTGIGIYMEDIDSATVNHLIGIDIGMNSNNQADDWHTFFRIKGHSGTAKAIFKINAAATYLFDFQGADTAAPLNAGYSTLTCRMPDGTSRTLALS